MVDPRGSIVEERLKNVSSVVAVSGGKGGVGKSLVASALALALVKKGRRVGLFDLDFTSPSTHTILGIGKMQPREEKGIIPPKVHGLRYMSIVYFSGECAMPLRGADVSNALVELLAITRWGGLDYLVLDMPPGIGDATLDLLRFMKKTRFLIVTTPLQLAFETVKKLTGLLEELKIPVIGIVENMRMPRSRSVKLQVQDLGLPFLGEIPYDPKVEQAIGDAGRLMKTTFAQRVEEIAAYI